MFECNEFKKYRKAIKKKKKSMLYCILLKQLRIYGECNEKISTHYYIQVTRKPQLM